MPEESSLRAHPHLAAPRFLLLVWAALVVLMLGLFFEGVHTGILYEVLSWAQDAGVLGVGVGIVVMAVFSIIPAPSELISIGLMSAFGVIPGIAYSWVGGILGAGAAALLAKAVARPHAMRLVRRHLPWLRSWLSRRGSLGLLAVRFVPLVPYHLVNYMAGILNVGLLPLLWTTALGTLPFQLGLAGVYTGVAYGSVLPFAAGGIVLALLVSAGWAWRRWVPLADDTGGD